jgi:activating signal cointegrator 1
VRALSVRQPWAELIMSGQKRYELRTWRTSVRGRIWIHAARTVEWPYVHMAGLSRASFTTGAFIGSVEIVDCVPFTTPIAEGLRRDGTFFGDPRDVAGFAWMLAAPERLTRPIPYRGSLGIFRVPADVAEIQD